MVKQVKQGESKGKESQAEITAGAKAWPALGVACQVGTVGKEVDGAGRDTTAIRGE